MADEYGGWDWGGGGADYSGYDVAPDFSGTDWGSNDYGDWGGWEDYSTPSWEPQPDYSAPQDWGPPSWASPPDIQSWNQYQLPQQPLPGIGGQGYQGVDAWQPPPTWDYSMGEAGPDPMVVPRPPMPWGTDTLPSQEDPYRFYHMPFSAPSAPDLTDPGTRFEAGLSDRESREQAQSMVAGGPVIPIHKTMQGGPEWLNPLANPTSGQELPWPIDANAPAAVLPTGRFSQSVWNTILRIPELAPYLDFLRRSPVPIRLLDAASGGAYGQTVARAGAAENAASPGLLGLIRASDTPEIAAKWRNEYPLFQPGRAGHEIDVSLNPAELTSPVWEQVMPNAAQLPENTLIHELRHAGGHLLPEDEMYRVGARAMSSFRQIPREMFTPHELQSFSKYPAWAWPTEVDARLFANRYFNPYLRR